MADRTVKVTLLAQVNGYLAGMDQAAKKTREFSQDSQERLAQQRQAFETVGRSAIAVGTAITALAALAVTRFAQFDEAMSQVKAVTQETAENMDRLRDAALEAGASTVFTATEAANAIEELGKNGLTTAQILGGGLAASLSLASAGGIEVARAAEIAAISMKQFGLEGSDLPHVADLLAAGAGKAAGDVDDLAQALNQAALVAAQTGLSIEDTTGVLAAFADAGLIGSDAGTSFRSMLQRLTPLSGEAAKEMERLGINAFDASGEFIGITEFAGVLESSLSTLTDQERAFALAQIFGSDAVRAANVLYEQGADGIADYIRQTDDAGYAAQVAADRLNNLSGDLEELGGAFDTALIKSGSAANDVLRFLTQTATDAVNGFNNMPSAVQGTALAVGGLGAAVLLTSGAFLLAVPRIAQYKDALDTMGAGAQRAGRVIGFLGKGVAFIAGLSAAALILDKLASSGDAAAKGLEETLKVLTDEGFDSVFADVGGEVTDLASALDLLLGNSVNANMERFGSTLNSIVAGGQLSDQVADTRVQFETLGAGLAQLVNAGDSERAAKLFEQMNAEAEKQGISTEDLINLLPAYKEALAGAANAADENSGALHVMDAAAQDTTGSIEDLSQALIDFGEQQLRADDAVYDFKQTLLDLEEAMGADGFTGTLDLSTQEGIDNNRMLRDIADSANNAAGEIIALSGDQDAANAVLQEARDRLAAVGEEFGLSGDALQQFIDKYVASPKEIAFQFKANGLDEAESKLAGLFRYSGRQIEIKLAGAGGFASGGYTGNIPVGSVAGVVHGREFVTDAAATAIPANRAALEFMNAGGNIANYATPASYAPASPQIFAGPSAAPQVNLSFADGMSWLKQFVSVEVAGADVSRQQTLAAGRQVR